MNKEAVYNIKKEAQSNKVFNDMFHVLATRKRARSVLTVQALQRRMTKEGFKYTRPQYAAFIKFLHGQGIGELDVSPKGAIRGLKKIKVTLESIGSAAVGQLSDLRGVRGRNRYAEVPPSLIRAIMKESAPIQGANFRDQKSVVAPISVNTSINGKTLVIHIPNELEAKDVADLISIFRDAHSA